MKPHKIGRYEIKSELGRGGMATVYHAHDPRFRRDVALKVLPREFLHDPTFRTRFEREAQTIAALEHSAIVPVYDFGEEDGQLYLVMRFLSGGSLASRLKKGAIHLAQVIEIINRLGPALDQAHKQGIIHRDLKPDNILFDQYDEPFITDFGIAKLTEESSSLTATRAVIGTPAYMSPEQVSGEELDGRSDLYALGVIIFQMLTGQLPYEAPTPVATLMKHITEPVPNILEVQADLPPGCAVVINRVMAKDRDERYVTAADLAAALVASSKATSELAIELNQGDPNIFQTKNILKTPATSSMLQNIDDEPEKARSIEELISELADPQTQVAAINQLAQRGEEALRSLVETIMHNDNPCARYGSAKTLGQICQQSEINLSMKAGIAKILAKTLADPDPEVRYWSAEALGNFHGELSQPVVEALTALSKDPDEIVRQQAQRSLQKLNEEQQPLSVSNPANIRLSIGEYGRAIEVTLNKPIYLGRTDPINKIYPEIDLTNDDGAVKGVSRVHAQLSNQDGRVLIEDLDSANGTYVNGKRLSSNSPEILQHQDQVHLGALLIEIEIW